MSSKHDIRSTREPPKPNRHRHRAEIQKSQKTQKSISLRVVLRKIIFHLPPPGRVAYFINLFSSVFAAFLWLNVSQPHTLTAKNSNKDEDYTKKQQTFTRGVRIIYNKQKMTHKKASGDERSISEIRAFRPRHRGEHTDVIAIRNRKETRFNVED